MRLTGSYIELMISNMFYWVILDEGIQDIIGTEGSEESEGSEQVEPLTLIPGAKKHELMEYD